MKVRMSVVLDDDEKSYEGVALKLPSGKALTFTPECGTQLVDVKEFGVDKPRRARGKQPT